MTKLSQFLIVLCIGAVVTICSAAEYARFTIDIDGDKKPEQIILSTSSSGDFQDFTVRINESTYTEKYFAVDGNLPELHVIVIDYNRPYRQLLIKTSEPAWCNYHILSYSNRKLYPLLKFKSDSDCESPQPHGNGTLSVKYWQSFWWKVETYRLDPAGTKLVLIPKDVYSVDVVVASKNDMVLEKASCDEIKIKTGAFVRIVEFNPGRQSYFLRTSDGACGWLKKTDLDSKLSEIPYAK